MFGYTFNFDQSLNSWDVSATRDMGYMFYRSAFSQQLCWDVPSTCSTHYMFRLSGGACIDESCGQVNDASLVCRTR